MTVCLRLGFALFLALSAPVTLAGKKAAEPAQIHTNDVAVGKGVVFVGGTAGLTAFKVADPTAPEVIGQLELRGTVRAMTLVGDRVYLAVGSHGLFVLEITDPARPVILGRYDPPGPVEGVVVRGQTAFVAEDRDGLSIVDLDDPSRPRRLARVTSRGQLRALALDENRLATAEGAAAVRVFDVSDPQRPRRLVELRSANGARDVAFSNGYLWVAAGNNGLLAFDLDRPRAPIAQLASLSSAISVTITDDMALVSNGSAGLQIVDVAAADAPRQTGSFKLPRGFAVTRAAREGDRVFIAAGLGELAIADLTDLARPKVLYPRSRTLQIRLR